MINYNSPAALSLFLQEHGLGTQKKFGQNFLIHSGAREELINALDPQTGEPVWEIGAGLGAMSAGLLERGAHVTAFEIDRGFCLILRTLFGTNPCFSLIEGNALKKLGAPPFDCGAGCKLFGNLPYNIAAILLGRSIEQGLRFSRMVVTVQREVARRIAAAPGSAGYSSLSVITASVYKVKLLSVFGGACFFPPPHVESQALRLDLRPDAEHPPPLFFSLVRALFAARRKTVKNNLTAFLKPRGGSPAGAELLLETAGIKATERAENLSCDVFIQLAGVCARAPLTAI